MKRLFGASKRWVRLVRYSYRTATRAFWAAAALFSAAAVFELLTLGAVVLAVRALDPGVSSGSDQLDSLIGTGNRSLVVVGSLLLGTQLLAAFLNYLSAKAVRRLGRLINHALVQDILDDLAREDRIRRIAEVSDRGGIVQSLNADAKMAGLALQTLFNVAKSAIVAGIYLVALFSIAFIATLSLVPVAIIAVPLYLRLAERIRRSSQAFFMVAAREYGVGIQETIGRINAFKPFDDDAAPRDSALEGPAISGFYDEYDRMLLANEETALLARTLQGLATVLALAAIGRDAISGAVPFSTVLVFVVAVGRVAAILRTLASHTTNLVRYHPMVGRVLQIHDVHIAARSTAAPAADLPIPSGSLIATDGAVGRLEVQRLLFAFPGLSTGGQEPLFIPAPFTPTAETVGTLVFGDRPPVGRLDDALGDDGLSASITSLGLDWSSPIDQCWESLSQPLRVALMLLAGRERGQRVVLSVGHTEGLNTEAWNQLSKLRRDTGVVGITEGRRITSQDRYDLVTVLHGDGRVESMSFAAWRKAGDEEQRGAAAGEDDVLLGLI